MSRLLVVAALVIAASALFSCKDDVHEPLPPPHRDLFQLTLIDSAGQPLPGLTIGAMNQYAITRPPSPGIAMPSTTIAFSLPTASVVWLSIYNYYDELVVTLLDSASQAAGLHSIIWDNASLVSGYYRYDLTAVTTQDDTLRQSVWIIIERSHAEPTYIGVTNSQGTVTVNDTLLFPCLLGNPPAILVTNDQGDSLFVIDDFYLDRIALVIDDTDGSTGSITVDTPLVVGPNEFHIMIDSFPTIIQPSR